jgi:lipoprotein-anchoring transpeptidase ErfK/SrfK
MGLMLVVVALLAWVWSRGEETGRKNRAKLPVRDLSPVDYVHDHHPSSGSVAQSAVTSPVVPPPTPLPVARTNQAQAESGIFPAQLALARQALSPGSLDGVLGPQTRAALRAFQQREGLPVSGELDEHTSTRLKPEPPLFTHHIVTFEDLNRLRPLGATWLSKSQQDRLDYETILELVAERSQSSPTFIQRLNPALDWSAIQPGTTLKIPFLPPAPVDGKAALVRISLGQRTLQAFDAETNLLAHFPCSIGLRVDQRPLGELRVVVVAPDPNYTFDPQVFPESAEAQELGRKLVLPPGPNNPVGTVWIGLDRPGYGIHGTPRPERVGRPESHGCFRLANWNAEHLLRLVSVGTPVIVEP